jgi:uncharacterized protein (DUF1015 family)
MAEIKPLRAWRYNDILANNIGTYICPPFDVVSEEQKQSLYREALNSIHISVPQGSAPAANAAVLLEKWKKEEILKQDPKPSLYVYYQHFSFPGESKKYIRKGFICNIRAYFWDEKVVLRHENSLPYSVNDRLELLASTQLNASPTHGLYTDEKFTLEALMDASMEQPIYDIEDYQGTRDVISIIDDPDIIRIFIATLAEKQVILADGHHRYESSLLYRAQQRQNNPNYTGNELYNYHLMYFTNTEGHDLRILPTHRLIRLSEYLDTSEILVKARLYFDIKTIENPEGIPTLIEGKHWTFGLLLGNTGHILTLKPEVHPSLTWDMSGMDMPGMGMPQMVKNTDLVVLHYFFIEKVLDIIGKAQRHHKGILYERSFEVCLQDVQNKKADLALIVNGISIEQVKNICYNGYLMPQKSTFFFPKAICGFVFGSIKETEK